MTAPRRIAITCSGRTVVRPDRRCRVGTLHRRRRRGSEARGPINFEFWKKTRKKFLRGSQGVADFACARERRGRRFAAIEATEPPWGPSGYPRRRRGGGEGVGRAHRVRQRSLERSSSWTRRAQVGDLPQYYDHKSAGVSGRGFRLPRLGRLRSAQVRAAPSESDLLESDLLESDPGAALPWRRSTTQVWSRLRQRSCSAAAPLARAGPRATTGCR